MKFDLISATNVNLSWHPSPAHKAEEIELNRNGIEEAGGG